MVMPTQRHYHVIAKPPLARVSTSVAMMGFGGRWLAHAFHCTRQTRKLSHLGYVIADSLGVHHAPPSQNSSPNRSRPANSSDGYSASHSSAVNLWKAMRFG